MRLHSFWTLVAAVSFSSSAMLFAQILGRPARPLAATLSEDAPPTVSATSLAGTLLDPSGAAIAQAQVSLLASGDKAVAQTTTDRAGSFHFDNVAPGNYILEFHAEGFRDARINTTLTARRQSPLRVTLPIAVPSETVTVASGISVPPRQYRGFGKPKRQPHRSQRARPRPRLRPGLRHGYVPLS